MNKKNIHLLFLFLITAFTLNGQSVDNALLVGYGKPFPTINIGYPAHYSFVQYQQDIKNNRFFWGTRLSFLFEEFTTGYDPSLPNYLVRTVDAESALELNVDVNADETDAGFKQLATLDGLYSYVNLAPTFGMRIFKSNRRFNVHLLSGIGVEYTHRSETIGISPVRTTDTRFTDSIVVVPIESSKRGFEWHGIGGIQFNIRLKNNFNFGLDNHANIYFLGGVQISQSLYLAKSF